MLHKLECNCIFRDVTFLSWGPRQKWLLDYVVENDVAVGDGDYDDE